MPLIWIPHFLSIQSEYRYSENAAFWLMAPSRGRVLLSSGSFHPDSQSRQSHYRTVSLEAHFKLIPAILLFYEIGCGSFQFPMIKLPRYGKCIPVYLSFQNNKCHKIYISVLSILQFCQKTSLSAHFLTKILSIRHWPQQLKLNF